ncbi:MAG: EAL domain-containing protein [Acidimicrobiales bacterium]
MRIALDDFGTGYSSLTYLLDFPIDVVKVDRSFVQHVDESSRDRSIVAAVLSLASTLELDVVAEGVETTAQVGALRLLGCTLAELPLRPSDAGR